MRAMVPRSPANRATKPLGVFGADSRTIRSRRPDVSDHDNAVI